MFLADGKRESRLFEIGQQASHIAGGRRSARIENLEGAFHN
jgi:hypothetical protein